MSTHLTQEELTDRLLGIASSTVDAHLFDCVACRREVEKLRSSISMFRGAARAWSVNAVAAPAKAAPRNPPRPWMFGGALAAVVSVIMAAASLIYVHNREMRKPSGDAIAAWSPTPAQTKQAEIERDNELLSQIEKEIAERVPSPMQPLQVAVSGETSSASVQAK